MAKWRKWSPEKVERLLALYREGVPLAGIAADLGMTKGAVSEKLTMVRNAVGVEGLPYRLSREWTAREIRTVEQMVVARRTKAEIAKAIGRTPDAVKMIMNKYGIHSPGFRAWSDDERAELRRMRESGKTMAEAAWRLGRTLKAVKWQCHQMRHQKGA